MGTVGGEGHWGEVVGSLDFVSLLGILEGIDCVEETVDSKGGEEGDSRCCAKEHFVFEMEFLGGKIILHYIYIITLRKGASTVPSLSWPKLLLGCRTGLRLLWFSAWRVLFKNDWVVQLVFLRILRTGVRSSVLLRCIWIFWRRWRGRRRGLRRKRLMGGRRRLEWRWRILLLCWLSWVCPEWWWVYLL